MVAAYFATPGDRISAFIGALLLGVIFSIPALLVGSILIGRTIAERLACKIRHRRVLIFTLVAFGLAILSYPIFLFVWVMGGGTVPIEPTLDALLEHLVAVSVLVCYITIAAAVTALHINHSERVVEKPLRKRP
jgi:hypothetical protein